jgi:uncharacterized membrane protein YgdD (TMEM256/DUF423 family)
MNKQKPTTHILVAAIICAVYVALGAFGAHGLESKLNIDQLDTYNTGLRYLIIHALGLLAINLTFIVKDTFSILTNTFIYTGMVFFSLSLVLHATKDLLGIELDIFAMFAPIGGLCYIVGWLLFANTVRKS